MSPLTSLLQALANNPTFRKVAAQGSRAVSSHPQVLKAKEALAAKAAAATQSAKQAMQNPQVEAAKAKARAAAEQARQSVSSATKRAGAAASAASSTASSAAGTGAGAGAGARASAFARRTVTSARNYWHAKKKRIFAFLMANFFLVIFVLQFAHSLASNLISGSGDSGKHQRRVKQQKEEREEGEWSAEAMRAMEDKHAKIRERIKNVHAEKQSTRTQESHKPSESAFQTAQDASDSDFRGFGSSSLFDDTKVPASESLSTGAHQDIDFETSFLVKMDNETEFTSSLAREGLTGKIHSQGSRYA